MISGSTRRLGRQHIVRRCGLSVANSHGDVPLPCIIFVSTNGRVQARDFLYSGEDEGNIIQKLLPALIK